MKIPYNYTQGPQGDLKPKATEKIQQSSADFRTILEGCQKPVAAAPAQAARLQSEVPLLQKIEDISRFHGQAYKSSDVSDFLELLGKADYLLRGVKLTDNAAGTAPASDELLAELRREFDMDNLPPDKQWALFAKLTGRGVLSVDDAMKTQYTVAPDKDSIMAHITGEKEFHSIEIISENKPKERLDGMIQNEQFTYRYVYEKYGRKCQAVQELAKSHIRVLDTLRKI